MSKIPNYTLKHPLDIQADDIEKKKPSTSYEPTAKKAKSDTHLYDKLPKIDDSDSYKYTTPFNCLMHKIADEFKNLNIDTIIDDYKPILSEFYELSGKYRKYVPEYNKVFENFVNQLCKVYNFERNIILVNAHKYTTSEWGNLYWKFMHLSSILLSYAYETNKIDNLLNFSTIIYNIDLILPCPKCSGHYQLIKESENIRETIKLMSFGSIMAGVQAFHNQITENVDKTAEYINVPNRPIFYLPSFAQVYKCIDLQNESLQKSTTYIKSNIDWQPKIHNLITIILSNYLQQSYSRVSSLLKRKVYTTSTNNVFNGIKFNKQYEPTMIFNNSDIAFMNMSRNQILYCLMRALLLQFQNSNVTTEHLKDNFVLNHAILRFHKDYPTTIQKLLDSEAILHEPIENRDKLIKQMNYLKTIDI